MKDLLFCVPVVAKTLNLEISRCYLADYVKELYFYFNTKILQSEQFLLSDWVGAFVFGVNLEIPNLRKYCMYNKFKNLREIKNVFDM